MQNRFLFVIATIVGLMPNVAGAVTFFTEDFESYTMDGDVSTVGNPGTGTPWIITNTLATVETEAQWHLLDTKSAAGAFGFPPTINVGPATLDGGSTPSYDPTGEAPGGLFMLSRADGLPPGFPTFPAGTSPADPGLIDDDPYDSRIDNGTYTGAANDIITPSFSTVGASGDVWLHTSVASNLTDNGQAIFDVDVSTDGGANWVNKFRRIAPGSGRNIASADFDADIDVDGADFLTLQRLFDYTDCTTCGANPNDIDEHRRDSDQRFSDWTKSYGPYTPLVATVAAGNAGGHHGELDLNLGAIGGASEVQVRFRHFESRDDQFIMIDNVVVDENAPAGSASETIFSEEFSTMDLGQMEAYTFTFFDGFFGSDTGGGSGTLSGHSWGAQDRPSPSRANGRYEVGVVGSKGVNHLGHPTAEGPMGQVPFAIIDSAAEEDGVDPDGDNTQVERLSTPVFDLTGYSTVILEWDDETLFDGEPLLAKNVGSVVLMVDDDSNTGPSDGDSILSEPDKADIDFAAPYLPYDQFAGGLFDGGEDPIFMHHRLDVSAILAEEAAKPGGDISAVYVAFQYKGEDNEYWAVDNILITGELAALAAVVPEPSCLLLALLGIPALAPARRRVRARQ
jgi:hypothetical protein